MVEKGLGSDVEVVLGLGEVWGSWVSFGMVAGLGWVSWGW